jgi:hypothetical protein
MTERRQKPKIQPDSYMTIDKQRALYEREMGWDAADRQVRLARLEKGLCVCQPSRVKLDGGTRVVHARTCPRRQPWMDEI